MSRIAIVGAGLSGRLLALNLLRLAAPTAAISIWMLDRGDERCMGPAYSNDADSLLLNVPAGRMGALADAPEHFVKWSRDRGAPVGLLDFLPRTLYREYVLALMGEALRARAGGVTLEHIQGEVTDIAINGGRATIQVADQTSFVVDRVVLALGNFPPPHPPVQSRSALDSDRYVRNPWTAGVLDSLSRRDTVFMVGTGQTTVDLATALHRRAHQGRIIALSRRGLLPLAHRGFEPYPPFFADIKDSKRLLDIFRTVRKHFERADATGVDLRAVIDSLRPDTQTLWFNLAEEEKHRFVRHLFRYWEIIRSRIPPASEATIDGMRASGQLAILAGRIRDLVPTPTAMEVHYVRRGRTSPEVAAAALVINCMGPELDYRRIDEPLVRNLLRRGLIRPGPAQLGIDARGDGAIIGENGSASDVLYTLGSTMRGVFWEVLAVPEIRLQAARLAAALLAARH